MKRFINSWTILGLSLVVLGWSPLYIIIWLANIGIWPDPHPNPIGLGLLYFFTFWPAVILLGIGIYKGLRKKPETPTNMLSTLPGADSPPSLVNKPELTPKQATYVASSSFGGGGGVFYLLYMGAVDAIAAHLSDVIWWPHMVANARQYAWDYGTWESFEQFQARSQSADIMAKTFIFVGVAVLILLFVL